MPASSPIELRFNDKWIPVPESGCWLWTGAVDLHGYGKIFFNGRCEKAHRISYLLNKGPLVDGLKIDHLCRVTCCVNPAHLELVTHTENMRRGIAWEFNKKKTHCPRGHEYSGKNLRITNRGHRVCKACMRLKAKEHYYKKKTMTGIPVYRSDK